MTDTITRIRTIRQQANALATFWARFRETCRDGRIDKHGAQFGGDDRFVAVRIDGAFCAYTGQYGDSSCSTFGGLVGTEKYLQAAVNRHAEQIFATAATIAHDAAHELLAEAETKLIADSELLQAVRGERE